MFKSKKTIIKIISAGVVIGVCAVAFINRGNISNFFYLNNNNITKDVAKDVENVFKQDEQEYFVYFYDKSANEESKDYAKTMKEVEKDGKIEIYKVNLADLEAETIENELFLNNEEINVFYVQDGEKSYQFTGAFEKEKILEIKATF